MKRSILLIGVAALLLAGTVSAAEIKKGLMEVEAMAGYQQLNGDGEDLSIMLGTGLVQYFVRDNVSVGVVAAVVSTSGPIEVSIYGIGVDGKFYLWTDKQWVPFVGGHFIYGSADLGGDDINAELYGPEVGVRFSVTANTSFWVQAQYDFVAGDLKDAGIDTIYGFLLGFSHAW